MNYTCPMHPEVNSKKSGRCPKCGMDLIQKSEIKSPSSHHYEQHKNSYKPLVIIIGLILASALAISQLENFSVKIFISNFMAIFFLTFASFKIIDLKGFAQGYSTYDLLAQKFFPYGYIYPFLELLFGLSMILNPTAKIVLIAEIIVMTFSGLGVAIKLAKGEKFQCVCLGTFLKVPLTKVTLIEDFGMAALAAFSLVL